MQDDDIKSRVNKTSTKDLLIELEGNPCLLQFIENQTQELCLNAVKNYGGSLQYVKNQTDKICLAAVESSPYALPYVKNQTEEMCLIAVRNYGRALLFVKNQTPEICLAAVQKDGCALEHVRNQTLEICLAAVNQDPKSLLYVKNQTPEICFAAVRLYGRALHLVRTQTEEICLEAIKSKTHSFCHVRNKTKKIILEAVKKNFLDKDYELFDNPNIHSLLKLEDINNDDVFINMSDEGTSFCLDLFAGNNAEFKQNDDNIIVSKIIQQLKNKEICEEDLLEIDKRFKIISKILYDLDFSYVKNLKENSPELFENQQDLMAVYEKMKIEKAILDKNNCNDKNKQIKPKKF